MSNPALNDRSASPPGAAKQPRWRVAVVGAGAVGGYFGGMLARAGHPTVMIGREPMVQALQTHGLLLDTLWFKETVAVTASTDLRAAAGADLVLFCVKSNDTEATARALAPHLAAGCTVVCLQNGVENAARVSALTGRPAIPAVVYLAAAVAAPGTIKHAGRGDLIVGPDEPRVRDVAELFQQAGVDCVVTYRINDRLWEKLICNCALNAVSALCQKTYGQTGEHPVAWSVVEQVVQETLAVARAGGVRPTNMGDFATAMTAVRQLTRQIAAAYSSTAQDLRRGKRTEIDALNGFVARRGQELGVPTPVNQTLWALVRAAEPAAAV